MGAKVILFSYVNHFSITFFIFLRNIFRLKISTIYNAMKETGIKRMFSKLEVTDFEVQFADDLKCLEFLALEKWNSGYRCRKCGNTNYCTGKTAFSRRCTRCKHDESALAHTLFHHCKIPLKDAFFIAFEVCCRPEVSTYELSRKLETRQMTCWKFKKKIMECIEMNKGISEAEQN